MANLSGHLGTLALLGFVASMILIAALGYLSMGLILKGMEPRNQPIAYQSHDVELIDPAMPSQHLKLHLTMAGFVLGAQSNITAFAKLQPTDQNRVLNADDNRTIPDSYFLWFDGTYCPTAPVDLYSPIPMCKLEFKRFPQVGVDWSNVYWQGTYSNFPDDRHYSTIGIRYAAGGAYGVTLTDSPDSIDGPFSEPFIQIDDASLTQTFILGNEANQLTLLNLGVSFLAVLVTLAPIQVKIYRLLKENGVFAKQNNAAE